MSRRVQDHAILEQLGARLRAARKAAGLTQARLAERAGLQTNSVSLMESGSLAPTLTTLFLLARAIGLAPRDLLDFEDESPPVVVEGDPDESRLLLDFRRVDPEARRALLLLARRLASPRAA
jgi:transcriptional regulator with XRE-family HTH domain